jgi:hypothetical protein
MAFTFLDQKNPPDDGSFTRLEADVMLEDERLDHEAFMASTLNDRSCGQMEAWPMSAQQIVDLLKWISVRGLPECLVRRKA